MVTGNGCVFFCTVHAAAAVPSTAELLDIDQDGQLLPELSDKLQVQSCSILSRIYKTLRGFMLMLAPEVITSLQFLPASRNTLSPCAYLSEGEKEQTMKSWEHISMQVKSPLILR